MRNQRNNQAAQDAYTTAHAIARIRAERILQELDNLPAPSEETHYGHVGDVNRISAQLQEVLDIMGVSREETQAEEYREAF